MSTIKDDAIEFIANLLYNKESIDINEAVFWWLCLDKDIKKEYMRKAKMAIIKWKNDELKVEANRNRSR